MRCASIDLPPPGGPTISTLWPAAAATSNARFVVSCPLNSEIELGRRVGDGARFGWGEHLVAFEMIDQCDETGTCQNLDSAGLCRFTARYRRSNQTAFGGIGAGCRWQHARNGGECSVKRQFAEHAVFVLLKNTH